MNKKLNCVLLIDDDVATNFIHKRIVIKSNQVDHVELKLNGKEALAYLADCGKSEDNPKPNLILLDINMPVMDGWDFVDAYKDLDPSIKEGISLVMLTSSPNPDDRIRAEAIPEIASFKNKLMTAEIFVDILKEFFPEYISN